MQAPVSSAYELVPSQLVISDTILGKGAFGEVRVARWRNIEVAYKRLHITEPGDDHPKDEEFDMLQEVQMLSKLRHPNLVLFLGVCKDAITQKTSIVTELLPCSLYDLLEVKKVKLTLPDILDLALDVVNGLDYLHRHDPMIVHRDISSKNILIGGNRAKIADLGQAKLFNQSTLSRQTGIPGAMAYSAPEVLTGKYTSKIDIFSFGILLCQLCTGDYPRIDKREQQIQDAQENFPILRDTIIKSVHFQPSERLDARNIGEYLRMVRDNDRYYPVSRRLTPEKDVGVLALHWMHEEIATKCGDLSLKLDQTTKQLLAEEQRWKREAQKVDSVQEQLAASQLLNQTLQQKLAEFEASHEFLAYEKHQHIAQIDDLKEQLKLLSGEVQRAQQKQHHLEGQLASKSLDLQTSQQQLREQGQMMEKQNKMLHDYHHSDAQQSHKQSILSKQLAMQVDYGRELEERLEQTLARWKQEKETFQQETLKCKKLSSQISSLMATREKLEDELRRADVRLQQYEGLPVPEEIKARFEDMQKDNEMFRQNYGMLLQERDEVVVRNQQLDSAVIERDKLIKELQQDLHSKEALISMKDVEIEEMRGDLLTAAQDKAERESKLAVLQEELVVLQDSIKKMNSLLENLRVELNQEKRMHMILKEKVKKFSEQPQNEQSTTLLAEMQQLEVVAADEGEQKQDDGQTEDGEKSTEIAVKHLVDRTASRAGVQGLVDLVLTHTHDVRIVWRAIRSLRELVVHDEGNRKACHDNHPELWVVNLLAQFPNDAMLQGQVARLVGTLSFGNDVFRRKVGEKEVMKHLCLALRNLTSDETVMLHCATAVTNLTHGSKENRSRFEEVGGIPALVQVMQTNQHSSKLQRQCCWAILTLSGSDEVAKTISQHNGDLAVMQAMVTHRFDGGVQQYGCWALSNLALANEDIAVKLKTNGIIEICQIALETHPTDVEVMRQARNALGVYAPNLPSKPTAAQQTSSIKSKRKNLLNSTLANSASSFL